MTTFRILVVDDEPGLVANIKAYLAQEGFEVDTAHDGPAALKAAQRFKPDLVVLDIMLPGIDGLEVLQQLRRISSVYVLLLSAKAQETDRVIGLTVGADDYLPKPFSLRELSARIKAVLRRGRSGSSGREDHDDLLVFHHLRVEIAARRAWKDAAELDLTAIEFDMLVALARHAGRVLSRAQMIEHVWGNDFYGDERVVDVHLAKLRKKIEDDPANPTLITTVRGIGYRFEDKPI
jgi:two-component system alkaline phosphatase synthesis response regulator PhoP